MVTAHPTPRVTRRAFGRLVVTAAGAFLATTSLANPAEAAPVAADALASHPIIGQWLAATPLGPAHIAFMAGGDIVAAWPHSGDGPNGYYEYTTSGSGSWRPVSDRGVAVTIATIATDAAGNLAEAIRLESEPVVSADGGAFHSDGARDRMTSLAPTGAETFSQGQPAEPMTGIRMWPE